MMMSRRRRRWRGRNACRVVS
ncbi:hypothetical protein E2C01_045703 [Portunus trituberculatus]|uniref:Uncharacterized protein n=1 Tax=Portunus trituberculatus TaxID=210409 RepID=A0A5B7G2R6_PORTR|nr:hypothetical protein [Portunus trituberculatus]